MKIILLSGGSGKRLWPLSNDSRAKQFLQVLKNEKTGLKESMLQRVYRQVTSIVDKEDVIIATNRSQIDMIQNQIGKEASIVVEPESRDTFPAIALACTYLYSNLGMNNDEVVVVISVDAFVQQQFYTKISRLDELLRDTGADIALLGVKPTYPSSKYGYLIPSSNDDYLQVERFIEKPSETQAQKLIEKGSYWNSGVFAFSIKLVLNNLINKGFSIDFKKLLSDFYLLPKNSFDYEIVENLSDIVALTYDGYWKDLGTWNTLTEEMQQNILGNGEMSDDSKNTHIINELELPVKVLGVSNLVVSVSSDGILVTDKNSSSKMKDMLMNGLFTRPMFVEKRWGWYRILNISEKGNYEIVTKCLHLFEGEEITCGNSFSKKTWTITSGNAVVFQNGEEYVIGLGDVIQFSNHSIQRVNVKSDLEIIEVEICSLLDKNDTVDLSYTIED